MVKIADFDSVSGVAKKPKSACGGILTLTILPALLLIYAATWLNNWYNGNLGAMQETSVMQLRYGAGYMMDGSNELFCMAKGGCWYTRYVDRSKCPPNAALRVMIQKAESLTTLFETGSIGDRAFQVPDKECAYAARGEKA